MIGLSVCWSLTNAPAETLAHLRKYVEEESRIIGSLPVHVEPFEVVAVVRGPAGFRSSANFEG